MQILSLGWPLYVGQLAVMANGIIDTAMAGHLSATDLAAVAIGASVFYTVYVGLMGALQAMSPVAAQHFGDPRRLRLRGLATVHAGEGVAVAGIDDQPPRLALRQFRPAQFHFRRGAF